MRWRLRPATEGDLPALVAMERSTRELPHWRATEYARYLAAEAGQTRLLLVADDGEGGGLAGFAAATLCAADSKSVELESVAVVPAARRNGVGRSLCEAVLEWSRQSGATALELEVRLESAGAVRLYTSLGFTIVGRRARYYSDPTDDALLMSRPL